MTRVDTWMPLYIGDYLADTMSLEAREHGAYLLLIMHYWRNGPLPDDDRALAGIARVERKTWLTDTGPIVRAFFHAEGGKLHHKRIDQERASAHTIAETKRAAAQARWAKAREHKKSNGNADGGASADADDDADESSYEDASAHAYASDVHAACISPSQSQESQEEKKEIVPPNPPKTRKHNIDPKEFDAFWQMYPRKDGKDDAAKAFAQVRKTATFEQIMAGLRGYNFSPERRYQKMPAGWLREGRWKSAAEQNEANPYLALSNPRPPSAPNEDANSWINELRPDDSHPLFNMPVGGNG